MPRQDHAPLLIHDGARWRTIDDKPEPFVRLPGGALVRPSMVAAIDASPDSWHAYVHVGSAHPICVSLGERFKDPQGEVAHLLGIPVMGQRPNEEPDGPLGEPATMLAIPSDTDGAAGHLLEPSAEADPTSPSLVTLTNGAGVPAGSVDGDPSVVGERDSRPLPGRGEGMYYLTTNLTPKNASAWTRGELGREIIVCFGPVLRLVHDSHGWVAQADNGHQQTIDTIGELRGAIARTARRTP
jgi:hypothetical protein